MRKKAKKGADAADAAQAVAANPLVERLMADPELTEIFSKALAALGDLASSIADEPAKSAKKGLRLGRKLTLLGLGGGVALAVSEPLRSKVLDALFGAEEEFQYSPPPEPAGDATSPVSAV